MIKKKKDNKPCQTQPIHNRGHMLDLIITYGLNGNISLVVAVGLSDHFSFFFTVNGFNQENISIRKCEKALSYS